MPDYAVLVKFCCVHSVSFLSTIYTLILHQHRLIVKSEIFVFAGRIFRFRLSHLRLSNSVETFFGTISIICIAFISIVCYHIFTQRLLSMPWQ